MRIAHIKIALFALVLAAPVAALLLFGVVEGYGRAHPDFPEISKMLRGKKGRMDEFGDAVLQRSGMTKLAIELRSWVSYRLVGFVDTPEVVSGKDGWLFYRQDFAGGRCINEARAADALRRFAVLIDMGRAAGIDVMVSISPDKSTIYPEMLSRWVRGYWKCRERNIATLRRLIKRWVPTMIDHAEPMLAERVRRPEIPLYYFGDTHWSSYGAAIALRQLLTGVFPGADAPPPKLSSATRPRTADLSRMLLLPLEEIVPVLDAAPEAELAAVNHDPAGYRTVIVHDSFYTLIKSQLKAVFPTARMHQLKGESDDAELGPAIMSADRLIINVVERALISRIGKGGLRWNTPMMIAIIKRNMIAAKACGAFAEIGGLAGRQVSNDEPGISVDIPAASPGRLPCLRLTLAAPTSEILELSLPDPEDGTFEPGHGAMYKLAPDERVVSFVLPNYAAGASIGLKLGSGSRPLELRSVEVGDVAEIDIPSAGR